MMPSDYPVSQIARLEQMMALLRESVALLERLRDETIQAIGESQKLLGKCENAIQLAKREQDLRETDKAR